VQIWPALGTKKGNPMDSLKVFVTTRILKIAMGEYQALRYFLCANTLTVADKFYLAGEATKQLQT
jgi:hypothetical protein